MVPNIFLKYVFITKIIMYKVLIKTLTLYMLIVCSWCLRFISSYNMNLQIGQIDAINQILCLTIRKPPYKYEKYNMKLVFTCAISFEMFIHYIVHLAYGCVQSNLL